MRIKSVLFCALVAVLCGAVHPNRRMVRRWKRATTTTTTLSPTTTTAATRTSWLPLYLRTNKRPSPNVTTTTASPWYEQTPRKTTTGYPWYKKTSPSTTTKYPWYEDNPQKTSTVPWYERTMSPKTTTTETWWNRHHRGRTTTQRPYWYRPHRTTTESYWNRFQPVTNLWDRYETTTSFWDQYINEKRTTNMWDRWEDTSKTTSLWDRYEGNGPTTSYLDSIDELSKITFSPPEYNFPDSSLDSTNEDYTYNTTGVYVGVPFGLIFFVIIVCLRLCWCRRRVTRTVTIVRRPATISVLSVTALVRRNPGQDDRTSLLDPKDPKDPTPTPNPC